MRAAGVPPIVTIIILMAFIVSAALTAWFITSVTRTASKRCLLNIEGIVYLGTNGRLYLSIRNDGTADCLISQTKAVVKNIEFTCGTTGVLKPGESIQLTCSPPAGVSPYASINDGDVGVLQTTNGNLAFTIVKP